MAARGIAKRDVDEYELWEVAAVFGAHRPPEPEPDPAPGAAEDPYAGFDFVAETEAAIAEGREPRLPPPRSTGRSPVRRR